MNNNLKKKYKKEKIKNIKKKYKYIYIFRYNNISNKNIILIKKKIKKFKIKSLIIKKQIIKKEFLHFKLEGCLFILYNNNINLLKIFFLIKNLEFLLLLYQKNIYSRLKIKKLFLNVNKKINTNILNIYIFFIKILKKI